MNDDSGERLVITKVDNGAAAEKYLASLRRLLQSCINDEPAKSSIGFLAPLSDHSALEYWLSLLPSTFGSKPSTTLMVATYTTEPDVVVATTQVGRMVKETHQYKGEIRKLLVHPSCRRAGVGKRMMDEAERVAKVDLGLDMLVLDTATETPARDFYARTGWTEWGVCPDYAKFADGRKADCSFFCKML